MPLHRSRRRFPSLALPDLEGALRPLAAAWAEGEALIAVGHHECRTTREALAFVDRIHRRRRAGTGVLLVLQDDARAARAFVSELGLDVPVRLEPDPYPLAKAIGLDVVPTLFLVERDGGIAVVSEGFRRSDLEALAKRLGVAGSLFGPDDVAPAFRPG